MLAPHLRRKRVADVAAKAAALRAKAKQRSTAPSAGSAGKTVVTKTVHVVSRENVARGVFLSNRISLSQCFFLFFFFFPCFICKIIIVCANTKFQCVLSCVPIRAVASLQALRTLVVGVVDLATNSCVALAQPP